MEHLNGDTVKQILILCWIIFPACLIVFGLCGALCLHIRWRRFVRHIEQQQRVFDALDKEIRDV